MRDQSGKMVRGLLGGAIAVTLMLCGCGTEGVQETTEALGNTGINHCIVIPGPVVSLPWQETGYCLVSTQIAVCAQKASTDCSKGRNVKTAPYSDCQKNEDSNACK
jgi:hypothetical protein